MSKIKTKEQNPEVIWSFQEPSYHPNTHGWNFYVHYKLGRYQTIRCLTTHKQRLNKEELCRLIQDGLQDTQIVVHLMTRSIMGSGWSKILEGEITDMEEGKAIIAYIKDAPYETRSTKAVRLA